MDDIKKIIDEALKLVVPAEEERIKARKAEDELKKRLDDVLKDYPGLEYRFLGSYARDTWLKGNLEIDVFILFPEETSLEDLERIGIEIGKSVVDRYEFRFASHPYVHGTVLDVEVDIVPCYKLKSAERIKSAVDRTPFHHDWLKDRIKGKENDVRLLKKFLKCAGIYGAEYKIRGFSGYLCELLIIFYGSFLNLIRNAIEWTRNTVIDVLNNRVYRKKGYGFFVVDPVDPKRNVAANLSIDNLARFVERCRRFLEDPSISFFIEREVRAPDEEYIRNEIEFRRTGLYLIRFRRPKDVVEDNLYPQLEKATRRIEEFLKSHDFMPIRSHYFADADRCYIVIETCVRELSRIRRHMGPPFEDGINVKKFLSKDRRYGHFIENGRYWTLVERKFTRPDEAIEWVIKNEWKSLGKNVGESLRDYYEILKGVEVLKIDDEEFRKNLVEFLCLLDM